MKKKRCPKQAKTGHEPSQGIECETISLGQDDGDEPMLLPCAGESGKVVTWRLG
jgi:hypothetical protein